MMTSGAAATTADVSASESNTSTSAGLIPAASSARALAGLRVMPVTWCPAAMSSGVNRRPMAPFAPAKNILTRSSRDVSGCAFEALQGFRDLGFAQLRLRAFFLFLLDHFLRRARNEIGIAEFGFHPRDIGVALRHLLGEPGALGGKVD